ncbi:ATP-binding protein [Labrenzia sp. 011]|uniref:sensor histidine kinase n=1 Tax=Labrenzia sp. 011 TaxID=2171494 RepID=UPI0010574D24|nr:ATP-binding protein [Labrenzia sp. 011]
MKRSPVRYHRSGIGSRLVPLFFQSAFSRSICNLARPSKLDLGATRHLLPVMRLLAVISLGTFPIANLVLVSPASAAEVRRVLILYESESTLFAAREIALGLQQQINQGNSTAIELYSEYLDMVRFQDTGHEDRIATFLAAKYENMQFDAIVAIGPGALLFALGRLEWIPDRIPIVAGAVSQVTFDDIQNTSRIYGILNSFDVQETVDLAARLHPEAKRLVVLTGSSEFDHRWRDTAKSKLGATYAGMTVSHLSDLSLEDFKVAVSELPNDSLLLVLTVFTDADGRKFVPRDAAAEIIPLASVPTYGVYDSFVGTGIVGGQMETFVGIGKDVGKLVEGLIQGQRPSEHLKLSSAKPVLDWRQVERWNIDQALLPDDALLENYEPSLWERYRWQIVIGLAIILLQSATILALVLLERWRRRTSKELSLERLQLAHMSRVSQLGQLSGSIAHELNQPLTSILTNVEAGLRMLDRKAAKPEDIRGILEDIASADKHATESVKGLRQLFLNKDVSCKPVNLNAAVTETLKLAKSELAARQTSASFSSTANKLTVRANFSQLQQITLNLVLNASEAVSHLPPSRRRIDIRTGHTPDGQSFLAVSDCGAGMTREMQETAFEPFVSQRSDGMGLGLPICRSIAQAHGGTLEFDRTREIGVRIVLTLPEMKGE